MKSSSKHLQERLWAAAEHLRANGSIKLNEMSEPILGLIFLKFAEVRFNKAKKELEQASSPKVGRVRAINSDDYKAHGVLYIPKEATFSYLLSLPESSDLGKAIDDAMASIEKENQELAGVLPTNYRSISKNISENNSILITLLKNFNQIPDDIEGDAFGEIYEYFLGEFARAEGQKGGEFFTPQSVVKLLVEIIEPYHGRIYDPACGSGGMFVQSARFIEKHTENKKLVMNEIALYGQEKIDNNLRIAKMNLAIHGLSGNIKPANSYYENTFDSVGKFDFVLANPPFNVKGKDKNGQTVIDPARIKEDKRYSLGLPTTQKGDITNANYLWMQIFASALNGKGRAGFVMANSASDAGNAEKEIRKKMLEKGYVDVIISVGANMFLNATLSCTLWFFDKGKIGTYRDKKVLFINAQDIFTVVDRAHNDWTEEQIQEISGIVRSFRGEEGSKKYEDIKGRCKVASLEDIKANDYSLNPGRYIEIVEQETSDEDFEEKMEELQKEFKELTAEAHELEQKIEEDWKNLL